MCTVHKYMPRTYNSIIINYFFTIKEDEFYFPDSIKKIMMKIVTQYYSINFADFLSAVNQHWMGGRSFSPDMWSLFTS